MRMLVIMESDFLEGVAIFLFFSLIIGGALSLVVWSVYNGISPMPTSPKAKECLFALLPQELQGKIYELGSGWGTLLFPLAVKYPSCEVIGYETSFLPYWVSIIWLWSFPHPRTRILRQDFFNVSLNDATLVVCYLYPKAMEKLKVKFENELKPGTFIISNTFGIPNWKPLVALDVCDLYHSKIYLYQISGKEAK